MCRIAVVCRASERPLADEDDEWMPRRQEGVHYREFLRWRMLENDAPEVPYASDRPKLVMRRETDTVDLYRTVKKTPPLPVDDLDRQVRLMLGATA